MSKLDEQLSGMRNRRAERQAAAAERKAAEDAPKVTAMRRRLNEALGIDLVDALEEVQPFAYALVRGGQALGVRIGTETWRLYWKSGDLWLMSPNSKQDWPIVGLTIGGQTITAADVLLERIEMILARQERTTR